MMLLCVLVLCSIVTTSHSGTLSAGMYTVMKHDVKIHHDVNVTADSPTLTLVPSTSTTTARPAFPARSIGVSYPKDGVCGSVDIRNSVEELKWQLQGCRVVEGYVRISLIDDANESDYENVSFPELREITCYLLLYRVRGLRNLGHLFPNLTVIRGNALFMDYALVVYEMMHLQELGLWELMAILRGSVRIAKNPSLCYLNTLNWKTIIAGGGDYYSEYNMDEKSCPSGCDVMKDCDKDMCWGSQQHLCHKTNLHRGCHEECLGGCLGPGAHQCFVCRGVINDRMCISKCPSARYEYLGRRCLTESQCRQLRVSHSGGRVLPAILSEYEKRTGWWPFNGKCVDHCPPGYEEVFNGTVVQGCEPCQGRCSHECQGAEVSSIADAQNLRGCTTINGSLEIYIRGSGSHIIKELEESLSSIEEIQGYLKISRSFPLTSLNFLKNLRIIHGDILEGDKYAFLVIENQNLQELWDWSSRPRNFTIAKGKISFHYNPKLCLKEIELLREIANLPNYTNYDVARESNGDKVACHVIDLKTNVEVKSSRSVLIEWEPCMLEDVLGYVIYYTEAPEQNVTEHEGLDACSNKGWKIKDVSYHSGGNAYQFLPHLEPFTQYAFYVKTYTKSNTGGQSKIQYFRTLPDRPSVPKEIHAYANSSSGIVLDWQHPEHPNGILSYYVIFGDWLKDEHYFMGERDYCEKPLVPEPDLSSLHGVAPDLRNAKPTEQCCEKVEAEPIVLLKNEDSYNILCKDQPHNRFEEYGEKDPCQNYFYTFIHDKSEKSDFDENDDIDDPMFGQKFPEFTHSSFFSASKQSAWAYLNKSILNENGVYERFVKQVDPNRTWIMLDNLQHFAVYNIHLIACREPFDKDENVSLLLYNETRCSSAGLVTVRTRSLHAADRIDNYTVEYNETDDGSVQLKWTEPKIPNGMVLKYRLEWGRTDGESFHNECLTREQYLEAHGGFILRNLMPGNYSFRVRATSLAGDGPPTNMYLFHIRNIPPPTRVESLVILLLLGIAILICFVMLFIMWRRKQAKKSVTIIASVNPDYMSAGEVYQEDEWELPSENLKLLKELGQGSFGTVHEAILCSNDIRCAVKMINENASLREKNEFLNEASMMKSFAGANHVVKLLGVVSKGNCPLVVMELMARGDLKSYLRKCREPPPDPPDIDRMLLMAAQIADGMAYLEAHKFVHRDLAARNCMVAEDLTVKIGDFGMTRDIYETDYYRNGNKGLLPVRWMSPESLKDGVFTSQSDVWSFGVVLWEMATLAEQPYQGLANEQVLHFVLGGAFLDRPPKCSDVLYQFMVSCWHRRPSRRPRFLQIVADLEAVQDLGSEFSRLSFYHSKEGQDLKEHLDQIEDVEAADDTMFDEPFMSCPPLCFYQLLEQDDSLLFGGKKLIGRGSDDGYVLPGDSKSEDDAIPTTSRQSSDASADSYVLPSNLPLPCYGGPTLPDISEESESLLPQQMPSSKVPQNNVVPLSSTSAPSHSSGSRNLNAYKDSYVPTCGGNQLVDIFKLEFPHQQFNRESNPNRVPDDSYVPPDNLTFETSNTDKSRLVSNSNTPSSSNIVQEMECTSKPENSEVPQFDNLRRVTVLSGDQTGMDTTDSLAAAPEESNMFPKVSTPKLPNGLVNGFVSRPKDQENGNVLPFNS